MRLRQLLRREQAQTVFQQQPQKLCIITSGSKSCVRIIWYSLLPAFVTVRHCPADGAGAGYTVADSGGVVTLVRALQIKRLNVCGSLQQCLGIFQGQNVIGSAEGCIRA